MTEEDNCPPKMLQKGISIKHPIEIHKGSSNYNPNKIGGIGYHGGDTGDGPLSIPECTEP